MAATYTVDASVFLSAFNPREPRHEESYRLLALMRDSATPIIVPTLLLPEVAAAVGRGQGDADLAQRFSAALRRLPNVVWVALDMILAEQSAALAARHRLRGSDAVYAAVALRFGSTLVTLDRQQRERITETVAAQWPEEALKEWPGGAANEQSTSHSVD